MDPPQEPSAPHDEPRGQKRAREESPRAHDESRGQKRRRDDQGIRGRGNSKGRGGRGGRNKRTDMGRAEWSRNSVDKRSQVEKSHQNAKRRKGEGKDEGLPVYATQFSKEELEAETKKPKRKVAVMIGYSGTGYKGLQLSHRERTIEGDLFKAFVDAGAISKANADDPKKISLVRCARTDKGVHAAGNLLSLKLIVEDENVVEKINQHLSPQIRVFGIERTNGSFSAYQFCDSRIYEYLIPTHSFLPPHPDSYLARKIEQLAGEDNDTEGYRERQREVSSFWADAEEKYIQPVLGKIDPKIRPTVQKALYEINLKEAEEELHKSTGDTQIVTEDSPLEPSIDPGVSRDTTPPEATEDSTSNHTMAGEAQSASKYSEETKPQATRASVERDQDTSQTENGPSDTKPREPSPLEAAIRQLKSAYITAKKAYRIHPRRLERVRSALSRFQGTHNFHNYTIEKGPRDPSAKRIIKSFIVAADPIIMNNTEWLSLKVHGQSFMMHQIRKMVSMLALVIRCGCHEGRIQDSYLPQRLNIPKAPSLGLLLERPVFDAYNEKLVGFGRESIDFGRHEGVMEEFKQREIYERIFREEEQFGQFHSFFGALDNQKNSTLLYLSSVGPDAVGKEGVSAGKGQSVQPDAVEGASSDEAMSGLEDG